MILDKDLTDFQYSEAIRVACAKCLEVKGGGGYGYETQNQDFSVVQWEIPEYASAS